MGSVTEIKDRKPPCRIEFRDTGLRLEAVADGSRPDPGRTVLVDSNGRFISANAPGWRAVISVWDSRGRYLSAFGREGEGPGELTQRGMLSLLIDGRDNVHVRDGAFTWSVFSPDHEFLRRVPVRAMGGLWRETVVILDDGSALTSDIGSDPKHYFHVVDSAGVLQRSFGPVGDGSGGRGPRPITHAGGETFWAAPVQEGAGAYVLEEWGIDGELRRTLRRDVSWWRWSGDRETSTVVSQFHLAHNGLLYVMVPRPNEAFAKASERAEQRRAPGAEDEEGPHMELLEVVVEVIDTRSGELLASDVYTAAQLMEVMPRYLFRGSLRGYRHEVWADGLPFVKIVSVELVPR